MAWDGESRLVQAVGDTKAVTCAYGYMSRRVMKTVLDNTDLGSPISDLRHLSDRWSLIPETDGTTTKRCVRGMDLPQTLQGAGGVGGLPMVAAAGGC